MVVEWVPQNTCRRSAALLARLNACTKDFLSGLVKAFLSADLKDLLMRSK